MEITKSSVKAATVTSISAAEEKGKSILNLAKPEDQAFVNMYGNNGLDVTMSDKKIEALGVTVGTKLDYEEVGYHLLTASKYEEVRDGMLPKDVKAYILTEMVNRMEACDQGMITPRQRDEYFSVVKENVTLAQTQTKDNAKNQ